MAPEIPDALPPLPPDPFLGPAETGRLCIALIAAEQERLRREGRIDPRQAISARLLDAAPETVAALPIDETTLGFDSLSRLDLILSVTRFFGLAASGIEDYLLVRPFLGDWTALVAEHFRRVGGAAALTFTTSGSTGAGKPVTHPRAVLEAEVAAIVHDLLPGFSGAVLSMVSPQHIYGFLWSCLLPRRQGLAVRDLHGAAPTRLPREVRAGDLLLGTPFTWAQLAATGARLAPGCTGVTAGAPPEAGTWAAARDLGLDRLIDLYGATETAGVGWREAEGAPFRLLAPLRRRGDAILRGDTALPVQDRLHWHGPDSFSVLGRRDSVVQVAGTNVCPEAVRDTLLEVPGVREAGIRLDGGRLKAFIVPDPGCGTAALEEALRRLVARRLPAPARPDRFRFGPGLPRSATGKLADW